MLETNSNQGMAIIDLGWRKSRKQIRRPFSRKKKLRGTLQEKKFTQHLSRKKIRPLPAKGKIWPLLQKWGIIMGKKIMPSRCKRILRHLAEEKDIVRPHQGFFYTKGFPKNAT